VQDAEGDAYDRFGKNGWVLAVERYMYDRDNVIGHGAAADAYLASVIAELDADNAKLGKSILPSIGDRKKHPNSWRAAQSIFHMWVRRFELPSGTPLLPPRAPRSDSVEANLLSRDDDVVSGDRQRSLE
jgi:hypothetical protein